MSEPLRIDTHIHLYSSRPQGEWWKAGYEIWEYGQRDGVDFSQDTGTLGETVAALGRRIRPRRGDEPLLGRSVPAAVRVGAAPGGSTAERARALAQFDATIGERYVAFNRWLMDTLPVPHDQRLRGHRSVGAGAERSVEHLREMAERGARGVKLHPGRAEVRGERPRMHSVYRASSRWG